jgi:hypothetical protein
MNTQSRRDLIAAISIILMFAGAFMLPVTSLGFVLVGAGAVTVVGLFVIVVRREP